MEVEGGRKGGVIRGGCRCLVVGKGLCVCCLVVSSISSSSLLKCSEAKILARTTETSGRTCIVRLTSSRASRLNSFHTPDIRNPASIPRHASSKTTPQITGCYYSTVLKLGPRANLRVQQNGRRWNVGRSPRSTPYSLPEADSISDSLRMFQPIFSTSVVFSTLLVIRLLSAAFATIPDCDEGVDTWQATSRRN